METLSPLAIVDDMAWKKLAGIINTKSHNRGPQSKSDQVVFSRALEHLLSDEPLRTLHASGQGKDKKPGHHTLAARFKEWEAANILMSLTDTYFSALKQKDLSCWEVRIQELDALSKPWPTWLLSFRDSILRAAALNPDA